MALTPQKIRSALQGVTLLQGLMPQELARIELLLRSVDVQANNPLLTVGETSEFVYLILSGTVCVYLPHCDGTRRILNVVGAGEALGEICAVDGGGHSASVCATERTTLMRMRRGDFCVLEEDIPRLSRNVKYLLTRRLRFATTYNGVLAVREVDLRVARLLDALAERFAADPGQVAVLIPLRLPQATLFDWAHVSRRHGGESIKQLREEGIVQLLPRRRLAVLDRPGLRRHCA